VRLNQAGFSTLSGQLSGLCREAGQATFSSEHELNKILATAKQPPAATSLVIKETVAYEHATRCADFGSSDTREPVN
jgi:hypothetical protein